MASEQIVYNIIARDQASKKFKDVGDASDKAGSRISGGFSKIGLLAGGAAAAIGGLGAAGAIMGIKTAAALEQANIGFTTLLGSSQKAGAYVKDLQKFAANTPFEFQGLVDSSRLLLGVGVASQKVIPMLTDFGDAAGALGIQQDAFQRIMLATSQAISAGKFQVGDINQIVQAGIPVWSLLSKSLGKPVSELRKMSSQGKLTADVVLPALQRQMHKDYGGSMAKQSQTLAGLWSTFTDTLSQGLAQAMLPLVPMLKSILPGAMSVMGGALQGIAAGLKFVITGVQGVIQWFHSGSDAANGVTASLSGLSGWVKSALVPALRDLAGRVLPPLKQYLSVIAKGVHDNQGAFQILGGVLTKVVLPAIGILVNVGLKNMIRTFTVMSAVLSHVVVPAVRFMASIWFATFGAIINGAAAAFGWVPKIGPKLKKAAAEFNKFRDDVNRSLNGIHDKTVNVKVIAAINRSNLSIQGKKNALEVQWRATGGPVKAGDPYIVGERRAELFVPNSNGRIVPSVPTMTAGGGGNTVNIYITAGANAEDVHRALLKRKREIGAALGLA